LGGGRRTDGDDAADGDQPNVIVIMTDQQRGGLTARSGFPLDTMPFVDSVAADGFWTARHCTTVPQCVPTRASLLTGRTASGNGVRINPEVKEPTCTRDLIDVMNKVGLRDRLLRQGPLLPRREPLRPLVHDRPPGG